MNFDRLHSGVLSLLKLLPSGVASFVIFPAITFPLAMIPVAMIPIVMIPALITFCASSKDGRSNSEIWVSYSVGGGMGIYADGALYGRKVEITTDGKFRMYRRYMHRLNEERSLRDSLQIQGEVDSGRMETLLELISRANFFELPGRLPDASPMDIEIREPAESVEMVIRREDGTKHRVRAHMGADTRHYPEEFIELHRYLRRWVRDVQN